MTWPTQHLHWVICFGVRLTIDVLAKCQEGWVLKPMTWLIQIRFNLSQTSTATPTTTPTHTHTHTHTHARTHTYTAHTIWSYVFQCIS